MKVIILYRPDSEHARAVDTFVHDFQMRNGWIKVELLNADEREGIAKAGVYGIMRYPAILVTTDDGQLLNMWEGETLPLMDEVAAYAYSG